MSLLAIVLLGRITLNLRAWVSATVVLFLIGSPAFAQNPLEPQDNFVIVARPLADGLARPGQWTAVNVSIMNLGSATEAVLTVDERAPGDTIMVPWSRAVELPENARKDVTILLRPGDHTRDREVKLVSTLGRQAVAPFRLQLQDRHAVTVGILGEDPLGITAIGDTWTGAIPTSRPSEPVDEPRPVRAGLLDTHQLPRHSAAYDGLDHIVWHRADPTQLGARELDALLGWTAAGGHLTLTVTDTWRQVQQSPMADALPLRFTGVDDTPNLDGLLSVMGLPPQPPVLTPRTIGDVRTDSDRGTWVMSSSDDGTPLWTIGSYGIGTVTVLSADPLVEPLSQVSRVDLWRNLLWLPKPIVDRQSWDAHSAKAFPTTGGLAGDDRASLFAAQHRWISDDEDCFYNEGWQEFSGWEELQAVDQWERTVRDRLSDIPGASPLPISWLISFSVVYLLVIGPVDFFVLRYLRKEPWTWISFPLTVALFSGVALAGTSLTKGSEAVVTRVELVDVLPGTDRWRGQTQLGVFSTRKTKLSLRSGNPDGVISPLRDAGYMNDVRVQTNTGPGELDYHADTWTLAYTRSTWVTGGHGTVQLTETEVGPEIQNQLGVDLLDVVVIATDPWGQNDEHGYLYLGAMKAGEVASLSEDANWTKKPPRGDLDWAHRVFYDHPEQQGGHLHPGSYRWTVLALAEPVEEVALTGLTPVPQTLTAFRAPLGAPVSPIGPSWNESTP
ncbi:MAG: hypothetical protein GWP91_13380, partial [Rhodobacterales bacterium]|nr:hypothetical protein [Rhodobacterales bacterium]